MTALVVDSGVVVGIITARPHTIDQPTVLGSRSDGRCVARIALRAQNDHMICEIPMRTSQMPATTASMVMERKGQTTTTTPAIAVGMPRKMCQPRSGSPGWLAA